MYIENIRKAFSSLSRTEKEKLAKETKRILLGKGKISNSVRPAEIEEYIDNFTKGKETKIKYFEGFIEALDTMYPDGAKNAFFSGSFNKGKNWRDLMLKLTNDIPVAKLEKYYENDLVIKELKSLFIALVEGCITEDEEITIQRLQALNDLIKK
ncbi:hypothetical protein [Brevibacillus sp. NRS-1366]|uniref:hypothetical protein n=1 Tax=Brevibacillus sp. NRS-1366 TaxID=3233899 RepID=UPI003D2271F7